MKSYGNEDDQDRGDGEYPDFQRESANDWIGSGRPHQGWRVECKTDHWAVPVRATARPVIPAGAAPATVKVPSLFSA